MYVLTFTLLLDSSILQPVSKVTLGSVSDRVLVGAGSTPCTLQFKFENNYATLLEKVNLSYKIKVSPPSPTILMEGRRRRAEACLRTLEADHRAVIERAARAGAGRSALQEEVELLEKQMAEMEGTVQALRTEELQLKRLVGLQEPLKFMSDNLFD